MADIKTGLQDNTIGAIEQFVEIASADPLSAVLLLGGAILVGFSVGVFGIVTLGAIGAAIKRGLTGAGEPNQPV
jgi:hypothetical protein